MLVYIIFGFIQGIFEWIPISSEGVLALASQWLVKNFNPIDIALFLHLGTFFAVLVYFAKDWKKVLFFEDKKLFWFLAVATAISLVVGFGLYNLVINMAIGSSLLFITGFGLLFTAYFHRKKKTFKIGDNKLAVIAGFLQGLAVIPGFSRSAATIFGLSLGKKSPSEILKISYMMSAPAVFCSSLFLFLKNPISLGGTWPALITSFVIGLLSLKLLLKLSQRINFFIFAIIFSAICFIGAIIVLIL
jgi:undecaprenyl-diphosphatase